MKQPEGLEAQAATLMLRWVGAPREQVEQAALPSAADSTAINLTSLVALSLTTSPQQATPVMGARGG